MSESKQFICWEEALDQEIGKLLQQPPLPQEALPEFEELHLELSEAEDDSAGRSLSVQELRARISSSLRSSMALPDDVYDDTGVLLLGAGSLLTKRFLELLRQRGIHHVRLVPPDPNAPAPTSAAEPSPPAEPAAELHTAHSRKLDEQLAGELQRLVSLRPIKPWRRPRLSIDDLKGQAARGIEKHANVSTSVSELCDALQHGRTMSATELRRSVAQFVNMAAVDFDLLPMIVALQQSKDEYLYDHCVNVALLSVAMASQLGLHREQITEIGVGALLHDIGMLRVPLEIRMAEGPLTAREWHEVHRHPLHTLDMLSELRGIPQAVRIIAYQAHERGDGEGYPRRSSAHGLHTFARIVAIADAHAAMTRERPYRPALSPYEATKTVLMEGKANRYDRRLIRALLDTIALFPIGSRLALDDGSVARVLRANPDLHTRPVVEVLSADGSATGRMIDLAETPDLHVVRAL